MDARVQWDMGTTQMSVWFFDQFGPTNARVYRLGGEGYWQAEEIEAGVRWPEPSLKLEHSMVKALVEAASDALPPSGQMAEHLKDAMGVRDRLLALVEASHPQRR